MLLLSWVNFQWQFVKQICGQQLPHVSDIIQSVIHKQGYLNTLKPDQNGCHFADDIPDAISWINGPIYG